MHNRFSLFFILIIAAATLALAAKPSPKVKVKVLDRVRLDVMTEDLEYVTNGPLAGQLVFLDESHVLGMNTGGKGKSKAKLLFDVTDVPGRPNGIAYVESLKLFVIDTRDHRDTLYFVDHKGKVKYTRTIQYLDSNSTINGVEGLAYIPSTSASYPDHLVLVTLGGEPDFAGHLQVIRLDGKVEEDIVIPEDSSGQTINGQNLGSVTFLPSNNLLVGTYDGNALYTLDFWGNVLSTAPCQDCVGLIGGFEGLARTPSGLIIGAGSYGNLVYFDENLNRLSELDKVYAPNLGLVGQRGIAWDSQDDQFLVHYRPPVLPWQAHVAAVPPNLDSATILADIAQKYYRVGGLAYLPGEDRFATGHHFYDGSYPSILIFDKTAVSPVEPIQTVDLLDLGYGFPAPLTYIPNTDEFAVSFSARPTFLDIVNRGGTLIRSKDFASMGVEVVRSVVFFNPGHPSGGHFLIHVEPGRRVLITDFYLNVLSEFDAYSTLGLSRIGYYDLVAITSGKYAGDFGMIGDSGELVIFSIK